MTFSGCQRPFPPLHWSDEDFDAFRATCAAINCRPEDLLLIIYHETARTFSPGIAFCTASGYPGAIGLLQFTKKANGALGITEDQRLELASMTVQQQLPYVEKFFLSMNKGKPFSSIPDRATLYQYVAAPATVGKEVLYTQKTFPCPPPSLATDPYCANPSLDVNKDGVITRSDLEARLAMVALEPGYVAALSRLKAPRKEAVEPAQTSTTAKSRTAEWLYYGAVLGIGGYLLWRVRAQSLSRL